MVNGVDTQKSTFQDTEQSASSDSLLLEVAYTFICTVSASMYIAAVQSTLSSSSVIRARTAPGPPSSFSKPPGNVRGAEGYRLDMLAVGSGKRGSRYTLSG